MKNWKYLTFVGLAFVVLNFPAMVQEQEPEWVKGALERIRSDSLGNRTDSRGNWREVLPHWLGEGKGYACPNDRDTLEKFKTESADVYFCEREKAYYIHRHKGGKVGSLWYGPFKVEDGKEQERKQCPKDGGCVRDDIMCIQELGHTSKHDSLCKKCSAKIPAGKCRNRMICEECCKKEDICGGCGLGLPKVQEFKLSDEEIDKIEKLLKNDITKRQADKDSWKESEKDQRPTKGVCPKDGLKVYGISLFRKMKPTELPQSSGGGFSICLKDQIYWYETPGAGPAVGKLYGPFSLPKEAKQMIEEKLKEGLEEKVKKLIEDLGKDDPKRRDTATEELIRLGKPVKSYIAKALKDAKDPEVKSRLERISSEIDRGSSSKQDKDWIVDGKCPGPPGCGGRCPVGEPKGPCPRCSKETIYITLSKICYKCAEELQVCMTCLRKNK